MSTHFKLSGFHLLAFPKTFHDALVSVALSLLASLQHHVLCPQCMVQFAFQSSFSGWEVNQFDVLLELDLVDLGDILKSYKKALRGFVS